MASIYKKTRDRTRPGASWYITYFDESGHRRTMRGCPDKTATERIASKLESDVAERRRGLIDPKAEGFAAHERNALAAHLAAWHAFLIGKGNTATHADLSRNRAARLIDLARAGRLSDLTPSRVQAALKALRDEGLSLQSIHHHVGVAKAFARWLARDGRVRENALAGLTAPNPAPDRRHVRRALTEGELLRLVEAANAGPPFRKIDGTARAWLYRVAVGTGFRASELASLTPESFDLTGDVPTVRVAAAYSKRRRDDVQPIRRALAAALPAWWLGKRLEGPCGRSSPMTRPG
jgi:integrase